jgi:CheY-like chemotaxis protein
MPRVLVVEDSLLQAQYARRLLADAAHDVTVAVDGVEAMECLGRDEFDAVVTAMMMPRLDGLGLVEAVRRDFPGLPVILVTAHGSEDIAARALRAGAASYVPKSHLGEHLVATLSDVLAVAGVDPAHRRLRGCLDRVDLRFTLDNDPALITPLIGEVRRAATQAGLCDRTALLRLGVALREGLVNAMEHGNLEADSALRQDDERIYRRLVEERRRRALPDGPRELRADRRPRPAPDPHLHGRGPAQRGRQRADPDQARRPRGAAAWGRGPARGVLAGGRIAMTRPGAKRAAPSGGQGAKVYRDVRSAPCSCSGAQCRHSKYDDAMGVPETGGSCWRIPVVRSIERSLGKLAGWCEDEAPVPDPPAAFANRSGRF